jgi:DNA-binding protein H-NS
MSYRELVETRLRIERLMIEKQNSQRAALRRDMSIVAKKHGFDIRELAGGRKSKRAVAPKYRDPKNRNNTWSGRGRMPLWLATAIKRGKANKDDFLA